MSCLDNVLCFLDGVREYPNKRKTPLSPELVRNYKNQRLTLRTVGENNLSERTPQIDLVDTLKWVITFRPDLLDQAKREIERGECK